jgi:hypothetical protein
MNMWSEWIEIEPGDDANMEIERDAETAVQDLEMQSMIRWAYYGVVDEYMEAALSDWSD